MRSEVILKEYPPNDAEARHLCEVAARLEALLPDLEFTTETGLGLRVLIMFDTVRFRDGFVIQDPRSITNTIGEVEANLILAAMDPNPDHSPDWWDEQRFVSSKYQEGGRCYLRLRELIAKHPDVAEVS